MIRKHRYWTTGWHFIRFYLLCFRTIVNVVRQHCRRRLRHPDPASDGSAAIHSYSIQSPMDVFFLFV